MPEYCHLDVASDCTYSRSVRAQVHKFDDVRSLNQACATEACKSKLVAIFKFGFLDNLVYHDRSDPMLTDRLLPSSHNPLQSWSDIWFRLFEP